MKFSISTTSIKNSLNIVSRVVSSSSPNIALKGIYLQAKSDNTLTLTGADSNTVISQTLNGKEDDSIQLQVQDEGEIIIDAQYLNDIVRKIDSDIVYFEVLDGSLTQVKGNHANFRINGMDAKEYPRIDTERPLNHFTVRQKDFAEAIDVTSFCAAADDTRIALTGIHFVGTENKLTAIATDSYKLAKKYVDIQSESPFQMTVPAKTLNLVKNILLTEEGEITAYLDDKKIQFITEQTLFQSSLLEGEYPDIERLIPTTFSSTLTLPRSVWTSVIDRSMFIKNDNLTLNRLTMSDEDVIISNRSQEIGEFEQSLLAEGAKFEGEPLEITFNAGYVLQCSRAVKGQTIQIKFNGQLKPFIMVNPEDDSILELSLPVRSID